MSDEFMSDEFMSRLMRASTDEERALILTKDLISTLTPGLQSMVWAAAVPRWFNAEILAALRPEWADQAETLYQDLQDLSFIEVFPDRGHNVHERTRHPMLNYLVHERPDEFRNLVARAKDFFASQVEPENYMESLYYSQLYEFSDKEDSFLRTQQDSLFHYAEKSITELLPEHLYSRLAFLMSRIRKDKVWQSAEGTPHIDGLESKNPIDLRHRIAHIASESSSLPERVILAGLDPSEDFVNADLSGMNLAGVDLSGYNLSGVNLRSTNLKGAFLRRANLRGANLNNAGLDRAKLSGANLSGATLKGARLTRANLRVAALENADLEAAIADSADFRGANLTGANLSHARMGRVDFRGAQLSRANLEATNLRCADLRQTYMRDANLVQAKLDGADLSNTNLTAANLFQASMQRVHGIGCILTGAILRATDFRNANFDAADFSDADFREAQLENLLVKQALFVGSHGLTEAQQESLMLRGGITSMRMVNDIGFTQADIDERIADLERSLTRLEEWIDTLRRRVNQEKLKRNVQALEDLVTEFQRTCVLARQQIYHYQRHHSVLNQLPEDSTKDYVNINEQIVNVGNIIRIVQIILVDLPGFIDRSSNL
jgi:uncharacterized protein YjbI with pentapeptide repeats